MTRDRVCINNNGREKARSLTFLMTWLCSKLYVMVVYNFSIMFCITMYSTAYRTVTKSLFAKPGGGRCRLLFPWVVGHDGAGIVVQFDDPDVVR